MRKWTDEANQPCMSRCADVLSLASWSACNTCCCAAAGDDDVDAALQHGRPTPKMDPFERELKLMARSKVRLTLDTPSLKCNQRRGHRSRETRVESPSGDRFWELIEKLS